MSENQDATPSGEGADLERQIRADRKFSLSEAIRRMGGGGLMKGASPVSRTRQAEMAIADPPELGGARVRHGGTLAPPGDSCG